MSITNLAVHLINANQSLSSEFGPISKIYLLTTENIKGILSTDNLDGKKVLTVAGSGDQMLNAYAMGASSVTCFDINYLSEYQLKLKRAAVLTLNYDEFLRFTLMEFGKPLDYKLFEKVADELDFTTKDFFHHLYSRYTEGEIISKLYYPFHCSLDKMEQMNNYFNRDVYESLASKLKEKPINFIRSDVVRLPEAIKEQKYDKILLSNINQSIDKIFEDDELIRYRGLVRRLAKSVNNGGSIQAGYIYDYYFNKNRLPFDDANLRSEVFKEPEFNTQLVDCYRFNSGSDGVVTYNKRLKK